MSDREGFIIGTIFLAAIVAVVVALVFGIMQVLDYKEDKGYCEGRGGQYVEVHDTYKCITYKEVK